MTGCLHDLDLDLASPHVDALDHTSPPLYCLSMAAALASCQEAPNHWRFFLTVPLQFIVGRPGLGCSCIVRTNTGNFDTFKLFCVCIARRLLYVVYPVEHAFIAIHAKFYLQNSFNTTKVIHFWYGRWYAANSLYSNGVICLRNDILCVR